MNALKTVFLLGAMTVLAVGICSSQNFGGGWGLSGARHWPDINDTSPMVRTEGQGGIGGVPVNEDTVRTAREIATHSSNPAVWTNDAAFSRDVFTFVRVIYKYGKGAQE